MDPATRGMVSCICDSGSELKGVGDYIEPRMGRCVIFNTLSSLRYLGKVYCKSDFVVFHVCYAC